MHALLTGRHPDAEYACLQRRGLDVEATIRTLFPAANTLAPDVPASLGRAIGCATAFAPADRYPDATSMAGALRYVLQHVTAPTLRAGAAPSVASASAGALPRTAATASSLASPAPRNAPLFLVSQDGRGDYVTIGEALSHAPPGARIEVEAGLYVEGLVIDVPVDIVAAGAREDVILEAYDAPCITMDTDTALVRGLTLRGHAGYGITKHTTVEIPTGRLALEDCYITSDQAVCVAIHGYTANPTMRRCTVAGGTGSNVLIYGNAHGLVEDCAILGGVTAGVTIGQSANPTIRRCAIYQGQHAGILVLSGGRGVIADCQVFANTVVNIAVKEGGDPVIRRCTIQRGDQYGIVVYEGGRGTVEHCEMAGHGMPGVSVSGGAPSIRQCKIHNGKGSGILFTNRAGGVVEECEIANNALAGVQIGHWSAPTIRQSRINTITGVKGSGCTVVVEARSRTATYGGTRRAPSASGGGAQRGGSETGRSAPWILSASMYPLLHRWLMSAGTAVGNECQGASLSCATTSPHRRIGAMSVKCVMSA